MGPPVAGANWLDNWKMSGLVDCGLKKVFFLSNFIACDCLLCLMLVACVFLSLLMLTIYCLLRSLRPFCEIVQHKT